jgi:hypothetical protein
VGRGACCSASRRAMLLLGKRRLVGKHQAKARRQSHEPCLVSSALLCYTAPRYHSGFGYLLCIALCPLLLLLATVVCRTLSLVDASSRLQTAAHVILLVTHPSRCRSTTYHNNNTPNPHHGRRSGAAHALSLLVQGSLLLGWRGKFASRAVICLPDRFSRPSATSVS